MTLQSAIEAELPFLRSEAEARMVDTFDVKVPTGKPEYNPVSKTTEPGYAVLFTTKGYVGSSRVQSHSVEVGARTSVEIQRGVRIPWDADEVPTGAVVECTAIGDQTPPRMLGRQYRVNSADDASQRPFCNLEIVEVLT